MCLCACIFKSWKSWHHESMLPSQRIYIILCYPMFGWWGEAVYEAENAGMGRRDIFFHHNCVCVCSSRKLWWLLIFSLIVSNYIFFSLLCMPLVPVYDLKVPRKYLWISWYGSHLMCFLSLCLPPSLPAPARQIFWSVTTGFVQRALSVTSS